MTIVSSQIVGDSPQADGRRWIRERHLDQFGLVYDFLWMADHNQDATAVMNGRASSVESAIEAAELGYNLAQVLGLGSLAVPVFNYTTTAQNLAALRAAYANATRTDAIFIGDFLSSLTNGQLQSIFSMTSGQVTTLRANKLTPAADAASTIRASAGQ